MHLIIIGLMFATGKFLLMTKLFGLKHVLYYEKWIELFFAVVLPLLLIGTFSGAVLAALSGLWLTLMLRTCGLFVKPVNPFRRKSRQ